MREILDFNTVKKHIDEWDPIDLLAFCPNDEYDGESRMIVDSFRKENDLGKLIYNIFRESFGESTFRKSLEECNQVAQKIMKSIKDLKYKIR